MNRYTLSAVALASLAVAGCASEDVTLGGNQPQPPVNVPQTGAIAGDPMPQQVALGRVSGPCTAPRQATLNVRRNQVINDGSLQVRYNGRDPSYRTQPFVYMFQTNAQLISVSGAQLQTEVFGLWQGQIWSADICGRRIRIGLQRVTDQAATISIR
jgi:hypothetical protein